MEDTHEMLSQYPTLTSNGFDGDPSWVLTTPWESPDFNTERIRFIAERMIPLMYAPSKTKKCGSYQMKHQVEHAVAFFCENPYISNGELILAMICAGFKPVFNKSRPKSLNCEFRVTHLLPSIHRGHLNSGNNTKKQLDAWENLKADLGMLRAHMSVLHKEDYDDIRGGDPPMEQLEKMTQCELFNWRLRRTYNNTFYWGSIN